jgi:hypothetical protein
MGVLIMGRYYSGDIEGKFWFGVQSSDDAVHFGAEEQEPNHINYYINDIEQVEAGLKATRDELGIDEQRLNEYFDKHHSYNNEILIKYYKDTFDLDITASELYTKLELLARLDLGEKIYAVVKEQGDCSFTAEL